ncbi:L-ascorbate metabolism protein UlaG, beta-lactamase superfamily [Klenkia brasiliensis]|uniref:L-ascorbate metabolism protein UlaG, beta-lactamase superfamily n=2 Tax=Klenkia brasiliensis TaxID=333142 RepID=A0A1G7XRY5_9ACTN|nr:L-ascorbate metabolism protein UlaG, beta-lactamase superfamily [Klenkia brasiliensis]
MSTSWQHLAVTCGFPGPHAPVRMPWHGAAMQLTKHGHACVVLSDGDRRLLLDPGAFTEESAWDGASALLITHEHFDHLDVERTKQALDADPALEVWTNRSVAEQLDAGQRVHVVGHGDAFTAAGFDVAVQGEWHAVIHPDIPRIANVGFLVDGRVFHPGDALTVPEGGVETLLLPLHAPWSKTGELIDYVREVAPAHSLAVHDGLLNETGLMVGANFLGENGPGVPGEYRRLAPGDSVTV